MSSELTRLAIIPGLLIIVYIYGKDKVEKEPISMILKLILFGVATTFVVGVSESLAFNMLPQYQAGTMDYALQTAFLIAALHEELVKFIALRIGAWRSPYFNYRFDGIVYGVSVAVGFAIFENIGYVAQFGAAAAISRAFTAVPLHAFCGAVMGIFFSMAKKSEIDRNHASSMAYTGAAMIVPMLIHGLYDTLAMLNTAISQKMLIVFVVFLYIVVIKMIKKMSAEDRNAGFY